jgi:hypothetical protein
MAHPCASVRRSCVPVRAGVLRRVGPMWGPPEEPHRTGRRVRGAQAAAARAPIGSGVVGGRTARVVPDALRSAIRRLRSPRLCGSLGVTEGARLLNVVLDFGEAPAVRVFGSRVEHLTGIAGARVRQVGRTAILGRGEPALSVATRSSTWNSRLGSASNRARYRMPLRSRTRTVCPSKTTDLRLL